MWGGGCGGGAGEVGLEKVFLYESKFKIIPGGRRGGVGYG